jgi:hypothetical protein
MREKKEPITVYWAPAQFLLDNESWNFVYQEPQSVSKGFYSSLHRDTDSSKCPAARFFYHNVFSINSVIEDKFDFPQGLLQDLYNTDEIHVRLPVHSNVMIQKTRQNEMTDHVNLTYNLAWFFFSEEELTMKFSAPYFPASSPMKNARLASGSFDIGRWLRPVNLEYYVPIDAPGFSVEEDQPLAFVEFDTDRPIVLQRFNMDQRLANITTEIVESDRYSFLRNLQDRYNLFTKTRMRDVILSEIKKNLV